MLLFATRPKCDDPAADMSVEIRTALFKAVLAGSSQSSSRYLFLLAVPGSAVCTATRYGLEGQRIESRWERDFRHLPKQAVWTILLPVQLISGVFPEGKMAGARCWSPTPI